MMTAMTVDAGEMLTPYYPGGTTGSAPGILPPPGFYFSTFMAFGPDWRSYDTNGHPVPGVKLDVWEVSPALTWVPGCKFLGADYAMAVSQPVVHWDSRYGFGKEFGFGVALTGAQTGTGNTYLVPYVLGWHLPCNFHVSTGLVIALDDGANSAKDSEAAINKIGPDRFFGKFSSVPASGLGSFFVYDSNGYTSIVPNVGISWLYHGWNISGSFKYAFATKDTTINYQTGDLFDADFTVTYTWGKWSFGGGIGESQQVTNDEYQTTSNPASYGVHPDAAPNPDDHVGFKFHELWGGPCIAYNFGPVYMKLVYLFNFDTRNAGGGNSALFTIVVPLGNPFGTGKSK